MLTIRRGDARGGADHGWLQTRHTFSFAGYHDPAHMGFRALRVINEDQVAPGRGFGTHGHRDMEILSWVLDGALEHEDSMGNGSVIRPGEIQRMSAGTGVLHSEMNHSAEAPVRFLQIWIVPAERGLPPGYEQAQVPAERARNAWARVASPEGGDGAVRLHQDASVWLSRPREGATLAWTRERGRHVWLHVVRGAVSVNGERLVGGDAASTSDEAEIEVAATADSELLLFDLA